VANQIVHEQRKIEGLKQEHMGKANKHNKAVDDTDIVILLMCRLLVT
jgi:4-hydroxy-3-methylbut-2-enyl diphosphate reductase IspH